MSTAAKRFSFPAIRVAQLAQEKSPDASAKAGEAPQRTSETSGSWAATCPEGESCRLSQSVIASATREPILVARAFKAPTPVVMVTVPAGIYLAPGLALQIDGGKSRRYPFETCTGEGCHTGLKLDDTLLKELSAGKVAKVSFFDGTQKVVTVSLSLAGFAQGYNGLK